MHESDYRFAESQDSQLRMWKFEESKRFWAWPPLTEEQKREAQSQEGVGNGLPLTESEIDKLAERYTEGREIPKRRTNFHE